jgi:hypothetical protein
MKIARILLTAVVALPAAATASAQMPAYPGMGGPYGGMPAAYFQPTPAPPINGAAPMPMGTAPMGADPMGAGGPTAMPAEGFGSGGDYGQWYGDGGGPIESGGNGYVGSNPGGRLPLFQRRMFRQRTGRGYASAEALLWNRSDAFPVVLNVQTPNRDTIAAGNVSQFTQPYMRASDPFFGYETLPRITLGYVLPNDVAVEFIGFYKDDFDAHFDSVGDSNLDSLIFGQQPLGSNWTSADAMLVSLSTAIHSYEVNIVETTRVFNFMTGFRYMEVADDLLLQTFKNGSPNYAAIGTYNHMFGMHSGVRTHLDGTLFGLALGAKVGYFVNDAQSHSLLTSTGFPGRDGGRWGGQNDAMVAETKIALTFRPSAWFKLRAGYDCMWIVNTALAADQIDENPTAAGNRTGFFLNANGDLFLHGPSAGMEVNW